MAGKKGRSGRPRKETELGIREAITGQIPSEELIASLAGIVKDKRTPAAVKVKAIELLLAYLYGKPAQSLTLKGDKDQPIAIQTYDFNTSITQIANGSEEDSETPSEDKSDSDGAAVGQDSHDG